MREVNSEQILLEPFSVAYKGLQQTDPGAQILNTRLNYSCPQSEQGDCALGQVTQELCISYLLLFLVVSVTAHLATLTWCALPTH